jgi:predicted alpha/beta-hydrolase family hydrolase
MKSILIGALAAIIVAIGAYAVLDSTFQQTADQRYATQGVRL